VVMADTFRGFVEVTSGDLLSLWHNPVPSPNPFSPCLPGRLAHGER
jgi:hypothetical protein